MNARKFENEQEFNEWKERNLIGGIIFEFGEFDSPMMYPCIIVYEFIEKPYIYGADEDEQYDNLREEGYDRDDIEKLIYHYVYPTDFDD